MVRQKQSAQSTNLASAVQATDNPIYHHEHDVPKNKKTSASSMSLKESKSRYEQLSTVEEPGDDP